jgi:hypothetical protein
MLLPLETSFIQESKGNFISMFYIIKKAVKEVGEESNEGKLTKILKCFYFEKKVV